MAINEVYFGDTPLISLDNDTVATANDIMAGKIGHLNSGNIVTGTATNDATITIGNNNTSLHLLSPETAYANGHKITGTMVNRGSGTAALATKNATYNISEGYYNGNGNITIASSAIADCVEENIKTGSTILGVSGTVEDVTDYAVAYKYWGYGTITLSSASRTLSLPAVDLHGNSIKAIFAFASGINKTYTQTGSQNYYVAGFEYTRDKLFVVNAPAASRTLAIRGQKNSSSATLQSTFFGYKYINIIDQDLLSAGGAKLEVDTAQSTILYFADTTYYITICG